MENKTKKIFAYIGVFILLCGLSSLVHFLFDWTHCTFFALFSPINESVWEHSKVVITPFVLVSAVAFCFIRKDAKNYFAVVAKSIVLMQLLMIASYYFYFGILGKEIVVIDILIAFLCEGLGLFFMFQYFNKQKTVSKLWYIFAGLVIALLLTFTFVQPNIPLFISPK